MSRAPSFLAYSLLAGALWPAVWGRDAGNTTCASGQLDWYTDVVGETPCATYQRLRQICNIDYKVPQFRSLTPGDNCDDQVSGCCCNSISWALSMLCMNCQYDTEAGNIGIDAGDGAYDLYLGGCGPIHNRTLPADIQTAVCNREINLDRNLYSLFWSNGPWFYVYTKETMTKDFAATNNNTFTHCNSTLRGTSSIGSTPTVPASLTFSPSATSATSPTESTKEPSTHIAPIAGAAVGGAIAALAIAGLVFFLLRRRRRAQRPKPLDLSKEYEGGHSPFADDPQTGIVTPFSPAGTQSNSGYGSGGVKPPGSEEFALLPRGARSPQTPEKAEGAWGRSHESLVGGGERHEDGGPVRALQRSASGRLPPAYRRSWEASEPAYAPPPETDTEAGGSTLSGASGGVAMESRFQAGQWGRDVKRPLS